MGMRGLSHRWLLRRRMGMNTNSDITDARRPRPADVGVSSSRALRRLPEPLSDPPADPLLDPSADPAEHAAISESLTLGFLRVLSVVCRSPPFS